VTQFNEPYKIACFWGVNETSKDEHVYDLGLCKFVEYLHVFPTIYLRRQRGLQCTKETCKIWTGRKSIGDTFFQTTMTHVMNFSIFTSGKTGTRRREHRVYWFLSSVYCFSICDGRNREILNSMMTPICSRNRPHRVVKLKMSSYELNPLKQKVVDLEGLGG